MTIDRYLTRAYGREIADALTDAASAGLVDFDRAVYVAVAIVETDRDRDEIGETE